MIRLGDTFEGYDDRRRLYVVLSEPTADNNLALVNLISHYPHLPLHDPACVIIHPSEHPWIRRESCVFYEGAVLESRLILETDLDSADLQRHPHFPPQLLSRIQLGRLLRRGSLLK